MTREIVLDTETTGLSPRSGDRVVEIGCVELVNHIPTGQNFHVYINPEREMPEEARRVHGLDDAFLADKPLFGAVADGFIDFVADTILVIHNASFDLGFLNAELERIERPAIANPVIDTVQVARKAHPGARVSLDALCRHYGIDNSHRTVHGALLDAQILAEVYLELIGGRQAAMALGVSNGPGVSAGREKAATDRRGAAKRPVPLPGVVDAATLARHAEFIAELGEGALWHRYDKDGD
jgi:DNA polymerase III subunit epsilon